MSDKPFALYILASRTKRLYVGVTADLVRRVWQYRTGAIPGFTRRYGITRLVHYEVTLNARAAMAREKQIKGWLRSRKIALIEKTNPQWADLSEHWFG